MLIEAGADLSIKDYQGKTVLSHAVSTENVDLVNLFIGIGSSVHVPDNYGRTPLLQCCLKGNTIIAEIIIRAGADVNIADGVSTLKAFDSQTLLLMKQS